MKIFAKLYLWWNGYCTKHGVKKLTSYDRAINAIDEAGCQGERWAAFRVALGHVMSTDKATCDLCEEDKATRHQRRLAESVDAVMSEEIMGRR